MSSGFPENRVTARQKGPPIFVVSGGTGATAELLARTVLAQFPDVNIPLILETKVLDQKRVDAVIESVLAAGPGAMIVHTMVNAGCRVHLESAARAAGITTFDLAGPLIEHLHRFIDREPVGQPGLYRYLHRAYFQRIEAIEFTVAHDDGKRIEELSNAEIVLVGVSRVGKTPTSVYLSMLGWKVANIPFVPGIDMPKELFEIERKRIVGLLSDPVQLLLHRKSRVSRTGIPEGSYAHRDEIVEELRAAQHFFYRHNIPTIDTSDKPIESCAEEVLELITGHRGREITPP